MSEETVSSAKPLDDVSTLAAELGATLERPPLAQYEENCVDRPRIDLGSPDEFQGRSRVAAQFLESPP